MNPLLLLFGDGTVFFVGIVMAVAGVLLRWRVKRGVLRPILTSLVPVGALLVALSATPLAWWVYGLWFAVCAAALVGSVAKVRTRAWSMGRVVTVATFILLSAGLCLIELPYHLSPQIPVSPGQTLYVVGDSLSAGIRAKERNWPDVLAERTGLKVVNLARSGATTETAFNQIAGIAIPGSVVIVEIGGNDLLSQVDSETVHRHLDRLLTALRAGDHRIAMFEIPLPPFRNSFGAAQRVLAEEHQVTLIPKRYLTRVFGTKDALREDDVHLTQVGHNALARLIGRIIKRQ